MATVPRVCVRLGMTSMGGRGGFATDELFVLLNVAVQRVAIPLCPYVSGVVLNRFESLNSILGI